MDTKQRLTDKKRSLESFYEARFIASHDTLTLLSEFYVDTGITILPMVLELHQRASRLRSPCVEVAIWELLFQFVLALAHLIALSRVRH